MATANSYGMTALNDGGSSVEKMEVLSEMGANGELTMRLQLPLMANTAWDGAAGEEAAKVLDSVQDLQKRFCSHEPGQEHHRRCAGRQECAAP